MIHGCSMRWCRVLLKRSRFVRSPVFNTSFKTWYRSVGSLYFDARLYKHQWAALILSPELESLFSSGQTSVCANFRMSFLVTTNGRFISLFNAENFIIREDDVWNFTRHLLALKPLAFYDFHFLCTGLIHFLYLIRLDSKIIF